MFKTNNKCIEISWNCLIFPCVLSLIGFSASTLLTLRSYIHFLSLDFYGLGWKAVTRLYRNHETSHVPVSSSQACLKYSKVTLLCLVFPASSSASHSLSPQSLLCIWYVMFSFPFTSKYFLISLVIYLIHWFLRVLISTYL